jgi:hydroxyacylglutathione hydrolase
MKIPAHLSANLATGLHVGETIAQFEIGNYKNFVYLILDWAQKKAAIVDPQSDLSLPLQCLRENGFELSTIFLTHTHFDHIAGLAELVEHFPTVPVILHQKDLRRLDAEIQKIANIRLVQDGDLILVGHLSVRVLYTPGHSAGECCYFIAGSPPYLFTGDTVFIRDCGRTDLDGGSNEEMFDSLQRIKKLPKESVVLPGHHYQLECASTLEKEQKESAPFSCKTVQELASLP